MGEGSRGGTDVDTQSHKERTSPSVTESAQQEATTTTTGSSQSVQSQSGSNNTTITSGDHAELVNYRNEYNQSLRGVDTQAGVSPGEFARENLADGAEARRVQQGIDGHAAVIDDPESEVVGTWNSFIQKDVVGQERINSDVVESEEIGRRSGMMRVAELRSSEYRAANKAFVSDYSKIRRNSDVTVQNLHNQMSGSALVNAMGVRAPRHAYNQETKEVFSENMLRGDVSGTTLEPDNLDAETANKINEEQLKDVFAANMIAGNFDLKGENVIVTENGNVTAIDYDYLSTQSVDELTNSPNKGEMTWIEDSLDSIKSNRTEEFTVTVNDVVDRATELATELQETGMDEQLIAIAEQYDAFFKSIDPEFGSFVMPDQTRLEAKNEAIDASSAADRIETHIEQWAK